MGLQQGDKVHLAVTLDRNEFRGTVSVSVIVKDWRFADTVQEDLIAAERLFDRLQCEETLTIPEKDAVTPSRDHAAILYRLLKAEGEYEGSWERLHHLLRDKIPCRMLRPCVEVLRQAGLIAVSNGGDLIHITLSAVSGKADLNDTPLMKRLSG